MADLQLSKGMQVLVDSIVQDEIRQYVLKLVRKRMETEILANLHTIHEQVDAVLDAKIGAELTTLTEEKPVVVKQPVEVVEEMPQ